ncbi:MAG TPA: GxxExxY protein [Verrucomicrobiae bacterium]
MGNALGQIAGVEEPIFKEESFKIIGLCMEVHRELGKGHSEVIYKDALQFELGGSGILFQREKEFTVIYKGVILPHKYFADFIIADKILLEAKAIEQ